VTDIIDQAAEFEALHRSVGMRAHEERRRLERERAAARLQATALARHQRPQPAGPDLCIDCDTPIPAARRRALPHADRCIGCQTLYERRL
jgi:RNA polymerase-binding transcription factor DksA